MKKRRFCIRLSEEEYEIIKKHENGSSHLRAFLKNEFKKNKLCPIHGVNKMSCGCV